MLRNSQPQCEAYLTDREEVGFYDSSNVIDTHNLSRNRVQYLVFKPGFIVRVVTTLSDNENSTGQCSHILINNRKIVDNKIINWEAINIKRYE